MAEPLLLFATFNPGAWHTPRMTCKHFSVDHHQKGMEGANNSRRQRGQPKELAGHHGAFWKSLAEATQV